MGMLRSHALADVVVVHSAPTADDVIFGGELRGLARTERIRLVEQHTDVDGMLDADDIAALVHDADEREIWACGPAGMLDALEARWRPASATGALPPRPARRSATAAPSPSPPAATPSKPTARPRCSTPARTPAC